jgi:hypothetical protein
MSPLLPGPWLSSGAQAVMICGVEVTYSPTGKSDTGRLRLVASHVISMPPSCPTGTLSST